jgi:type I restriction enzyme M protein
MSVRTIVKSIQDIMRQDVGVDGDAQRISQLCWMFFLKIIDDQDQQLQLMQDGYRSPIPGKLQWRTWAANPEGITGDELLAFINGELFPGLKKLQLTGKPGDRRRVVRDVFEDAYNYMKSGQLMRQVVNKISGIDFNNLTERQHFGDIYEQVLNDLQSAGNAGEYYTPRAVTAFMADRIDPKPGEILLDPACGTGGFLTCSIRHMRERYVKRPEDEQRMQAALRAVEKKQLPHMLCVTNMLLHGIEDASFVRHDNTLARPYISYTQSDRVDIVLTNPPFGGREEDGIESNFPRHFQTRETADLFLALIIRLLKPGGRAAVVLPDGTLFGEGVKTRLKEHLMEECNLHTIVRLPNSVFKPYASIGTNLLFFEKGEPTKDIWFYEHRVPVSQKAYSMTKPIRFEHLQGCIDWWGGPKRKGREETPQAWKVTAEEVKARGYNLDIKNPHTVADDHGDPEELLERLDAAEAETARLRDQLQAILAGGAGVINAERLLEHFARIAKAPDAIPRLRRFILDLAARGKLVPQDPNDEPVSELLKRKKLPRCPEGPFDLPGTWAWVSVGAIAEARLGKMLDKSKNKGTPRRYLRNINVRWFDFDLSDLLEMRFEDSELPEFELRSGDVLICEGGEPGRTAVWDERGRDIYFQKAIHRVRFSEAVDPHFFVKALRASADDGRLAEYFTGTGIKHFTGKGLDAYLFPLPPLAEQRRIVVKVDELMALCDQLETSLATGDDTRRRLLDALLAEALAPGEDVMPAEAARVAAHG